MSVVILAQGQSALAERSVADVMGGSSKAPSRAGSRAPSRAPSRASRTPSRPPPQKLLLTKKNLKQVQVQASKPKKKDTTHKTERKSAKSHSVTKSVKQKKVQVL